MLWAALNKKKNVLMGWFFWAIETKMFKLMDRKRD